MSTPRSSDVGPTPPVRLFVYGSLKEGEANHPLLAGAESCGAAVTEAGFELVDLGPYPGLVAGGRGAVAGELYRVGATVLARLDAFEGHPAFFRRSPIRLADGGRAEAYLLSPGEARGRPRITPRSDGGDGPVARWRGRRGGRRS